MDQSLAGRRVQVKLRRHKRLAEGRVRGGEWQATMRAPSRRVTFVVAFLVANFLLFFPFAPEAHEGPPDPTGGGEEELEAEGAVPEPGEPALPESSEHEPPPDGAAEGGAR